MPMTANLTGFFNALNLAVFYICLGLEIICSILPIKFGQFETFRTPLIIEWVIKQSLVKKIYWYGAV